MPSGLGFIIIANLNHILLVGAMGAKTNSPIMVELAGINLALQFCNSNGWFPDRIFCDCPGVADLLKNFNVCTAWHINEEYIKLKKNLASFPQTCVDYIPQGNNEIADALANFGRLNHQLSLFYQGFDRPTWLEDSCSRRHFVF